MTVRRSLTFVAPLALVLVLGDAAVAQRSAPPPAPTVPAETVSELQVRILRLERLVEQLTGQVEELSFRNGQMARQLQQLQDDLSLRVARLEQGGQLPPAAGTDPAAPTALAPVVPPAAAAPAPAAAVPAPGRQAFAPSTPPGGFDPNAPLSAPVQRQPDMAPRPADPGNSAPSASPGAAPVGSAAAPPVNTDGSFSIRTDASGRPLPPDPNAPRAPIAAAPPPPAPAPQAAPNPAPVTAAGLGAAPVAVTLPQGPPKQQYDYAFDFLKRQDYARAEAALREFLKRNPKDPLAGNAQYWLGESLYVRGDYQAAAVEFMNGYTNYPKSNKGPDNLLKLGLAMANLNQNQGACTALSRIPREYPDAPENVRKAAQAERVKLKCA